MSDDTASSEGDAPAGVGITTRVRVFPSSDREVHGVIVDDFGESIGIPVEIGGNRIAGPARRWAVMLDDDNLLFVDTEDLEAE
ncbi:hypothetical protein H7J06_28470 [Mycobacterium hodleri]|uniref:hypothetical protein n=1 Tax=Mycolicibacterium hodleri TaxID=49897 RepID=UPI0021F39259|nr:hypothetical protein [Mycolicibacterium hodleri]MCV7136909.1 hypothetical protein [Mycolicibacterium hodleri]